MPCNERNYLLVHYFARQIVGVMPSERIESDQTNVETSAHYVRLLLFSFLCYFFKAASLNDVKSFNSFKSQLLKYLSA